MSEKSCSGLFRITLQLQEGSTVEYKYTRGSWDKVEVSPDGSDNKNRSLYLGKGHATVINDEVCRWKDMASVAK